MHPQLSQSRNTASVADNGWIKQAWTQFEIPDDVERSAGKIYFAIRDVSATANGDGYDSPTTLIKTIDYALSAQNQIPRPPGNLIVN